MNKFKFGDRVRCLENVEDLLKIGETYLIDSVMEDFLLIKIKHEKFTVAVCKPKTFELVERKIGDKWYKAEELNEDGMPIDSYILPTRTSGYFTTGDGEYILNEKTMQWETYTLPNVDISNMSVAMSNEGTNVMKEKIDKNSGTKTMEYLANFQPEEEFKVDKLGSYEVDDKTTIKVVHISSMFALFVRNNDSNYVERLHLNGKFEHNNNYVVKYLGPELPKYPRKFEFEGLLEENKHPNLSKLNDPVSICLKNDCWGFYKSKPNYTSLSKISKWKVSMEEVLE